MTDAAHPAPVADVLVAEVPGAAPGKTLSPAARRALEEAASRRAAIDAAAQAARQGEENGPAGPEPTRFGDWERKGVAIDFS
jgi:hypothetical protein